MPKFFPNAKVRMLPKRGDPSLPDEVGIVMDALPRQVDPEKCEDRETIPQLYTVLTLENCPPGCSKTEIYREDELELVSCVVSLDIYQFA